MSNNAQMMSDGMPDPSGSRSSSVPSNAPPATAGAPGDGHTSAPLQTTQAQRYLDTPPAPSRGFVQTHPILTIIGVILVVALALGIGVSVGRGTAPLDIQQSTINTISTVDPSVVQVQGHGVGPGGSIGSGEILTSSGYIVTNSHVVHGFTSFKVQLSTGELVSAQLVGDVPSQDLAVLKISASNLKPIAVGDSSQVQVGESAIAIGSPLGLEQTATDGIVSALNREGKEVVDGKVYTLKGMIQTSAPINPGNSGGALVNLQGQLVGIPTLAAVDSSTGVAANGVGYAISSNQMETVVAPFIPEGS